MRRLLVNDMLSALPGHRTFWNDLQEWFGCEFVGDDYGTLADSADTAALMNFTDDAEDGIAREQQVASLIIRNATYFPPLKASEKIPTISLLQDIFMEGPQKEMQEEVLKFSAAVVWNSEFTAREYEQHGTHRAVRIRRVIPLPVDFSLFEPGNAMGLQQALSLPDGATCWIGACREAGPVKGWDIFLHVVRANPDLPFVAVLKDAAPPVVPPNLRVFVRLTHEELVRVIGACRVGLCTSRMESQHLAGIEMGACGLPMVAPPVGVYWNRKDLPGLLVAEQTPQAFGSALRAALSRPGDAEAIRGYWEREFNRDIVRTQWTDLINEVEGGSNAAI